MGLNKAEILSMVKAHGWDSVYDQEVLPQDFIIEYACYLNLPFLFANNKIDNKTSKRFESLITQGVSRSMYESLPVMIRMISKYFTEHRLEVIYKNKNSFFDETSKLVVIEVHIFIESDMSFDITIGPNANTIRSISSSQFINHLQYFDSLDEKGFLSKVNSSIFHLFN